MSKSEANYLDIKYFNMTPITRILVPKFEIMYWDANFRNGQTLCLTTKGLLVVTNTQKVNADKVSLSSERFRDLTVRDQLVNMEHLAGKELEIGRDQHKAEMRVNIGLQFDRSTDTELMQMLLCVALFH